MSFRLIEASKKVEKSNSYTQISSNLNSVDSQFNTTSNNSISDKKQQKPYNFNIYFPTTDCKS